MKVFICLSNLLFSFLIYATGAIDIQVSEAPDNDLKFTLAALKSAKKNLLLNMYELTSPEIGAALVERVKAGVHVEILQEGELVGGFSVEAKGVQDQILAAMKTQENGDRLFVMTSKAGGQRRYGFDHAKYAVIDGNRLLLGSENYSPNGNPVPGKKGNRGWEVLVVDSNSVNRFTEILNKDKDTSFQDVLELTSPVGVASGSMFDEKPSLASSAPLPLKGTLQADRVTAILSPDNSLSGLLAAVSTAKQTLDIEQMTFAENWGKTEQESPLLDAVLNAARRGIRVRVLINDDLVFSNGHGISKNGLSKDILNQAAKAESLPLQARIANLKKMGVAIIHNKGLLADEDKTLISSINWNENSVEHNREAALLIESRPVHAHYAALFEKDWAASE